VTCMGKRARASAVGALDGVQSFGLVVLLFGLSFSEATKSIGLGLAVAGFVGKLVLGVRPRLLPRGAHWALLAFYLAGALSVATAAPGLRRPAELFTLGMTIVPFLLVADACARPSRKLFLALTIVAGGAAGTLIGYFEHMTGHFDRAVLGSIENAIPAAEYLGGVVPLAVALLLEEVASPLAGPLLGLAAGSMGIMFVMSKSRGPLPAAIAGLSMAVGMSLRRWRYGIVTAVACTTAFAVFIVANPASRAANAMEPGARDSGSRLETWKQTAGLVAERPVTGHGLGSFPDLGVVYEDAMVTIYQHNAHNAYLQVASDAGVLGAGSLLVFLVLSLIGSLRRSRASTGLDRAVSVGTLGGAVAVLLSGLFSVSIDAEPGILLFSLLALGSVPGLRDDEGEVSR
jgi:O-antigen ligase